MMSYQNERWKVNILKVYILILFFVENPQNFANSLTTIPPERRLKIQFKVLPKSEFVPNHFPLHQPIFSQSTAKARPKLIPINGLESQNMLVNTTDISSGGKILPLRRHSRVLFKRSLSNRRNRSSLSLVTPSSASMMVDNNGHDSSIKDIGEDNQSKGSSLHPSRLRDDGEVGDESTWLDMGSYSSYGGSFGWYIDHPVGNRSSHP